MATTEFKMIEARAFWRLSSTLRHALRVNAPRSTIDDLQAEAEVHARYGISPRIRQRADVLVSLAQRTALTG